MLLNLGLLTGNASLDPPLQIRLLDSRRRVALLQGGTVRG